MKAAYFSDLQGLHRPDSGLHRGTVPERVRNACLNLVLRLPDGQRAALWVSVVGQLDWSPTQFTAGPVSGTQEQMMASRLAFAIRTAPVADFLDLLTAAFVFLERDPAWREGVNHALARHYSAYAMAEDGLMYEPGSLVAEQAIADARGLLMHPDLSGADRQFQDAVLDLQRRPNPNLEGAVAGALNALEGVARVALSDRTAKLGNALKRIGTEKNLHPALAASLGKLYGYASDEGGRHGLVGDPKVGSPEAEFCVHQAAAGIVLICRLYGFEVVEGARRVPTQ